MDRGSKDKEILGPAAVGILKGRPPTARCRRKRTLRRRVSRSDDFSGRPPPLRLLLPTPASLATPDDRRPQQHGAYALPKWRSFYLSSILAGLSPLGTVTPGLVNGVPTGAVPLINASVNLFVGVAMVVSLGSEREVPLART